MDSREAMQLRLPSPVKDALRREAVAANRSLTRQIQTILEQRYSLGAMTPEGPHQ